MILLVMDSFKSNNIHKQTKKKKKSSYLKIATNGLDDRGKTVHLEIVKTKTKK